MNLQLSSDMSEDQQKTSNFFRPWLNIETTEGASEIDVEDTFQDISGNKEEDDDESIMSSATSTTSTTSTCLETSNVESYLDQGTADSTSSTVFKWIHPRSESFDDVAISTSSFHEDEDVVDSTVQDAKKKQRALHARLLQCNDAIIAKNAHVEHHVVSFKRDPTNRTIPARDLDKFNINNNNPIEYLSHEFRGPQVWAPVSDEGYAMEVVNPNVVGSTSVANVMFPALHCEFQSQFYPAIQPTIPPGMLPSEFYNRSMEEAVQMIHRQDAVDKQMKKMRPKKFRCKYCVAAFSNNGQLKGHHRIHTGERPFKCESCGKSFTRNEELTRHKRIHTGVRPHGCIVCGKKFGRKDHLKKHARTHEIRMNPYHVSTPLGVFALNHSLNQAGLSPYIYISNTGT